MAARQPPRGHDRFGRTRHQQGRDLQDAACRHHPTPTPMRDDDNAGPAEKHVTANGASPTHMARK